ncbi:MAG: 2-phospho-L-lactate guanylyltransferase [Humibacillus sp.]
MPTPLLPDTLPPDHLWRVVIPVKDTRHGKSRLASLVGPARADLSRAIADDTIAAAVATVGAPRVVLVTADPGLARRWEGVGVVVVADPGSGLNDAITVGMQHAAGFRVAVLLGDVPALTPADLASALASAQQYRQCFVPDFDGTGTVLRAGDDFIPRFGADSAHRHEADGAVRLELDLPRLRTDVDDAASLGVARRLGVGEATSAILTSQGSGWIPSMQASVHTYDPATRAGSVLLDDGLELAFDAPVMNGSGLRLLRVGQRLTIEVVDHQVVALRIVGIGPGQVVR